MKTSRYLIFIALIFCGCSSAPQNDNLAADKIALEKTKAAFVTAFAHSDVKALVALHHPDIVKYFGGSNVVTGRAELAKGLTAMFRTSKMELIQNQVESTAFNGNTIIETCIFAFRATPVNGGKSTIGRGRSMTVFVRYKDSPYGWVSIREMAQAAPDDQK
ncbi:nuclear transport factor 2 family protein [Mucilaginibacter sp. cycad4]|uniref:YybH family protein n=1 Tax=Mucilaginibacter sp. cycad4 TaxID=3342096 RepID=UPI002AAAF653|nr:nuclear transport factor 2 family protein [Mucilaginibacter gossypii]WPV00804.1 nuclear transport factor 2 family protein [Mucilaginibacter gossypii]